MKSIKIYTISTLILLLALPDMAFGQRVSKALEAKVEQNVHKIIGDLKSNFGRIYYDIGTTEIEYNSNALKPIRRLFYNYNDPTNQNIWPGIIDPGYKIGVPIFPEDTMISINAFLDTLTTWYCTDSSLTSLALDIYNQKFDWDDYYYDPDLLCFKVYANLTVYGESYVPYFDPVAAAAKSQSDDNEFDQLFADDFYGEGSLGMDNYVTLFFLVRLEGENIRNMAIYRIYRDVVRDNIFLRDIRKIVSERDKLYIGFQANVGKSNFNAKFNDIKNFDKIDKFHPYYNFQIDVSYFFNDGPKKLTWGIGGAIGYSKYQTVGEVKNYQTSYDDYFVPFEMDYIRNVYADGLQQEITLDYASFTPMLKIRYKLINPFEIIFAAGPSFSYLTNENITFSINEEGYVKYEGLFTIDFPDGPQDILMDDLPEYGFTTYTDVTFNKNEIGFTKFNVSASVNLGINWRLSHKTHISAGVNYQYGFLNLIDDTNNDDFILSENSAIINNIFNNCTSLKVSTVNGFVSFSYLINSKLK